MLCASIRDEALHEQADTALHEWIDRVTEDQTMPLTFEAALAQGFKHAANRRRVHSQDARRARLQYLATVLIRRARFWYSRLTLLHALCLWQLSRSPGEGTPAEPQDPVAVVERWMRRSKRQGGEQLEEHPFVREAAELVLLALKTGRPERYVWIDESGVVGRVGSQSTRHRPHARGNQWLPRSHGWIALDRRAQQLVGDVQLLLNLAERGDDVAAGREERLGRVNHDELPMCLTSERTGHLRPSETVGSGAAPVPGDDCRKECRLLLCPYPPKGQQPYRVELSEAFCRHQAALLRPLRSRARWQQAPKSELRRFWRDMEKRARA